MLNLTKAIIESVDQDNYETRNIEFVFQNNYKYNGYHKLFEATLKDNEDQILKDFKSLKLDAKTIVNLLNFFNSFYFDSNNGYQQEKRDNDKVIYYLSKRLMINVDEFIDFIKSKKEGIYVPSYVFNLNQEFRKEFVLKVSRDIRWFKESLLSDCLNWSVEPFNRYEKFDKSKRIMDYNNYCIDDNDMLFMYNNIKDYLDKCEKAKYLSSSNTNPIINYNLIVNDKFKDKARELIKIYANIAFSIACVGRVYVAESKLFKNILDVDISDYVKPKSLEEIDIFEKVFGSCKYSILKNDEE